ncbi:hypothetical protein CN09_17175 [Rhizobium rhizogenes]|nr:hypothetical protein CN09_17175 [Rhizobium rhizogenes]MQB35171.1 hypothetical protein [Rhizobium rhizogenes]
MIGEPKNACSSSTQIYGMTIQVANPVKSLRQNPTTPHSPEFRITSKATVQFFDEAAIQFDREFPPKLQTSTAHHWLVCRNINLKTAVLALNIQREVVT